MNIVHLTEETVGVKGGKESHIARFIENSIAAGHQNVILPDTVKRISEVDSLENSVTTGRIRFKPDIILLHSRGSWALADMMRQIAPTYAWIHDYAFMCPASISWFRENQEICHLPLGMHCITNAYTKWCNARRPDRNIRNYLAVRHALSKVASFDGLIVASEYMKERLITNNVPLSSIHVLPYFITKEFTAEVDYSCENPNRILFVGRLTEVKGVEILLDALSILPEKYELILAGDGYQKGNIERHRDEIGLAKDRVVFAGYVDDENRMRELYQTAAVVTVPSLWPEPFGIVGLESFLYGKPVVAFDVGGISEWLADGEVGLLAMPANAVDLAAKLLRLLEDSSYRHQLGLQGNKRAKEVFSWEKHWERFLEIVNVTHYESCLS